MNQIHSIHQTEQNGLRVKRSALFRRTALSVCSLICLISFCHLNALGQQRAPRSGTNAAGQQTAMNHHPAAAEDFDKLAADADAARTSDRLDEAITLYRRALAVRPQWAEGWWFLATILYDRDKYAEAARAFKETAKLQPKAGATWAMLGLCEFQLERYDDAFNHIEQGRELGLGDNPELVRVMLYHEGVLYLLKGEFEKAQQRLDGLAFQGANSDDLIIALGLSVLRMGMTPKMVVPNYRDRDVVRRAGLAEYLSAQKNIGDATREYELLVKDYPKFPNVQYAYGRFLLASRDEDGALAAFKRELDNSPKHALARMQMAYILLQRKDAATALPLIEEAIKLHPRLPLGHYLFGRILFETGQNARAIEELETARQMVPDEPKIYFALARAYTKANRKADAERAREIFTKLNQQSEEDAKRGGVRGDAIPEDTSQKEKSSQP